MYLGYYKLLYQAKSEREYKENKLGTFPYFKKIKLVLVSCVLNIFVHYTYSCFAVIQLERQEVLESKKCSASKATQYFFYS